MVENHGIIHPEAKFLISCEPVNQRSYLFTKHSFNTGIRQTLQFPEGEIREEGERSQDLSKSEN